MVGVISHESWKIECHRQSAATVFQQIFVAPIGFLRRGETGKLTHGIKLAAIAGSVNAARERRLPWISQVLLVVPVLRQVGFGVEPANGNPRNRGEASIAVLVEISAGRCADRFLGSFLQSRRQGFFRPFFLAGGRLPCFEYVRNRAVRDLWFLVRHVVPGSLLNLDDTPSETLLAMPGHR